MDFLYLKFAASGKASVLSDVDLYKQAQTSEPRPLSDVMDLIAAALRVCPASAQELPFQLLGR